MQFLHFSISISARTLSCLPLLQLALFSYPRLRYVLVIFCVFVCFQTRHFFGSCGPLKTSYKPHLRRTENVAFGFEQTGGIAVCKRYDLAVGTQRPAPELSHPPSLGEAEKEALAGTSLDDPTSPQPVPNGCLSPGLARAAGVSAREQKKQGLPGVERGPVRQPIRARLAWRCGTGPPR